MIDINDEQAAPIPDVLAKAYPAQALMKQPGWLCTTCGHRNPVTAPFCEKDHE